MAVIAMMSSLTLILNSLLSIKVLNEVFTRYDLAAMILIGTGLTFCVYLSDTGTKISYTTQDLYDVLLRPRAYSLIIMIYTFAACSLIFYKYVLYKVDNFYDKVNSVI